MPGGGHHYDGYWGLGQILDASDLRPPYSERFLTDVGTDLMAADRERAACDPDWPRDSGPYGAVNGSLTQQTGTGTDPLAGLMHAASSNPDGAQALLTNDLGHLDTYLTDRTWLDSGNRLGEAIESAAAPNAGDPRTAAQLAVDVVDVIGDSAREDIDGTNQRLSEMRDSVGRMLGERITDVNHSINGVDLTAVSLENTSRFGHQDLAHTLKWATQDQTAFDTLVAAQLDHTQAEIDASAERGYESKLYMAADNGAQGLSAIIAARTDGDEDKAFAADQQHGRLFDWARTGMGLAELTPTGKFSGLVLDAGMTRLESETAPNAVEQQRHVTASYAKQADLVLKDMVTRAVVDHQFYTDKDARREPPADWNALRNDRTAYASFDNWAKALEEVSGGAGKVETGYAAGQSWYTDSRDMETHVRLVDEENNW